MSNGNNSTSQTVHLWLEDCLLSLSLSLSDVLKSSARLPPVSWPFYSLIFGKHRRRPTARSPKFALADNGVATGGCGGAAGGCGGAAAFSSTPTGTSCKMFTHVRCILLFSSVVSKLVSYIWHRGPLSLLLQPSSGKRACSKSAVGIWFNISMH